MVSSKLLEYPGKPLVQTTKAYATQSWEHNTSQNTSETKFITNICSFFLSIFANSYNVGIH